MINEKMINSVKNTLDFVQELRSKSLEELQSIIKENNIECNSRDRRQMLEAIFTYFIKGEDMAYYKRYLEYSKVKKARIMGETLDSLSDLTEQIDGIYADRKEAMARRDKSLSNIKNLKSALTDIPFIRVRIAFSHVENRKKSYISIRTKDGMQRANIDDSITDIKRRGIIIRSLKTQKVKKLQKDLEKHDEVSIPRVKKAYTEFTDEVKAYCELLRKLFYDLLDNMTLRKGAYKSYRLVNHIDVNFDAEDLGIQEPTLDELNNIDKESIYLAFIKFANFPSADELDSKQFQDKLTEFIVYYDKIVASRADLKISGDNSKVAKIFAQQKELVSEIITKKDEYVLSPCFSLDEEDTYSLVFTGLDGVSKK